MSVESIKEAISQLSAEERAALTAWLLRQDMEEWDRQMEQDFADGDPGVESSEDAEADVGADRAKMLDQFLAETKARRDRQKPSR